MVRGSGGRENVINITGLDKSGARNIVSKMKIDVLELPNKDDIVTDDMTDGKRVVQNHDNIKHFCLKQTLTILTIAGLHNFKRNNQVTNKMNERFYTFYRGFVFLILSVYVAQSVVALFYTDQTTIYKRGMIFTWVFGVFVNFLLCQKAWSLKYGHQNKVFKFVNDDLMVDMKRALVPFGGKRFKRQQYIMCAVVCCLVLGNTGFHVCTVTGLFGQESEMTETTPFPSNVFTKILSTVTKFYATLVYVASLFYIITLSLLLKTLLDNFNTFFKNQTCQDSCKIPEDLHNIRLLYTKICKAITEFDKDFSYLNGNIFFWNLGQGLFILYVILKCTTSSTGSFEVVIYAFWLMTDIGALAVMSVTEAKVNTMAHAPLDTIYFISVRDITVEKLAELNMFLSQLTGTQIGFTTCGLLTITKEFILTIAGVFLTYFAVLYTL